MQARIVGPLQGARWLGEGWRLFRAAPLGWLVIVFVYWLIMTFLSLLPLVGALAASILVPAFSVGFMAAARSAATRGVVELPLLFEGFRRGLQAQLVLGVVYLGCLALALAGTALADGGALARWMAAGQRPAEETLRSGELVAALVTAAALYLPVMMLFWFAPLLAAWHAAAPAKALFFSLLAFLMNWRAFLAYGAVTAVMVVALPFLALSAAALVAGGEARLNPMPLVFPLLLVLLPTLFASFYASYRDIFGSAP